MAGDKKINKRKAAPAPATIKETQPPKKVKKDAEKADSAETKTAKSDAKKSTKKTTAASKDESVKSVPVKVDGQPARQIKPRKRAADYLSDEEGDEEKKDKPSTVAVAEPSKKKSKGQNGAAVAASKVAEKKVAAKSQSAKAKKAKAPSPVEESSDAEEGDENDDEKEEEEVSGEAESEDEDENEASQSEDEQDDDQTAALIQGFESSDDEDVSGDEGFRPGQQVPTIPDSKQVKRKLKNKKKETAEKEEPGVVYVGRIPHGFYEHEMRAYFSQFGEIKRLRLSRNRKTGQSKHFAFIEFAATSVAKVVADTMDNYLMFGHILKCKFVPKEQVHPQLWKGANKRFKKTPWNDIERRRLEKPKSRDQWTKKIDQEQKRRTRQAEKLKAIGYDFQMPDLKKPDEVLNAVASQPAVEAEAPKAIEAASPEKVTETEPAKKEKKGNKSEAVKKTTAAQPAPATKVEKQKAQKTEKTEDVKEKKAEEDKPKKVAANKSKKNKKTKA